MPETVGLTNMRRRRTTVVSYNWIHFFTKPEKRRKERKRDEREEGEREGGRERERGREEGREGEREGGREHVSKKLYEASFMHHTQQTFGRHFYMLDSTQVED